MNSYHLSKQDRDHLVRRLRWLAKDARDGGLPVSGRLLDMIEGEIASGRGDDCRAVTSKVSQAIGPSRQPPAVAPDSCGGGWKKSYFVRAEFFRLFPGEVPKDDRTWYQGLRRIIERGASDPYDPLHLAARHYKVRGKNRSMEGNLLEYAKWWKENRNHHFAVAPASEASETPLAVKPSKIISGV